MSQLYNIGTFRASQVVNSHQALKKHLLLWQLRNLWQLFAGRRETPWSFALLAAAHQGAGSGLLLPGDGQVYHGQRETH